MPNNHKIVITGLTEKQKQILLNVLRDAEASGAINFSFSSESEEKDIVPEVLSLAQAAFAQTNWLR